MALQKNGMGTETCGFAQGDSRVHTIAASRIGSGCDDPALIGASADDDRFSLQRRIVEFLYRDEKSIHINMEVGARHKSIVACGKGQGFTFVTIVGEEKFTEWLIVEQNSQTITYLNNTQTHNVINQ